MSFYDNQAYNPCSLDEQVEWVNVLVPVPKVPASSSYSPMPECTAAQQPYYDFIQMNPSDPIASPTSWDQSHADPSFPVTPLVDDLSPLLLDADFAFAFDKCLDDPAAFPSDMFPLTPFDEQALLNASPAAYSPELFVPEGWEAYSATGSNLGSPAATTSPTTATGTPLSTPPTPNLEFCSAPDCFEVFEKAVDRKKHERKHKQNFCCPLCNKGHLDKRALDRHLWTRHEEYAIRTGAKSEKTKCRVCDYSSRADNVRRHERSQHPGLVPSKLR
ncbi:hypothetical protein OQA88_8592 [Cercophora sp. LCS_1]